MGPIPAIPANNRARPIAILAVLAGVLLLGLSVPRLSLALSGIFQGSAAPTLPGLQAELAASPMRPTQWLTLAEMRETAGDLNAARSALRMSIYAGSVEPAIMGRRLALALRLVESMPIPDQELVHRQIRLAYILRPVVVMRLAMADPAKKDLVFSVLSKMDAADYQDMIRIHALH